MAIRQPTEDEITRAEAIYAAMGMVFAPGRFVDHAPIIRASLADIWPRAA